MECENDQNKADRQEQFLRIEFRKERKLRSEKKKGLYSKIKRERYRFFQ